MKLTHSAKAQLQYNSTVGDLKSMLQEADVPDHAKINVHQYAADRPGETSYTEVTFIWETDLRQGRPIRDQPQA